MRTTSFSGRCVLRGVRSRALFAFRAIGLAVAVASLLSIASAQNPPGRSSQDENRRGPSPQDIQARILNNLRERFEVTNDEEWAVISERLLKVFEVRRSSDGGGSRGGPPGGGPAGRPGSRGTRGGSPETQALQQAITDKMPDAEVKLRLARLREVRRSNESKLAKVQDDLRAVLTLRQEAIAVMYGLLP